MLHLISLLSFLLPSQVALHFTNFDSTVYGFTIDYLIPTLYLTDIVALIIILLGFRSFKFTRKFLISAVLYFGFVLVNVLVSDYQLASIYRWLKVTEIILLGVVLVNTKKLDVVKNFLKPLSYSVVIACTLGILQSITKGSIGGLFYWFGERRLSFSDPGISPYPYSFFSHPNSFAGFLLVFGLFLVQYKSKFNTKYFWILVILIIINLILTNSLNVYLTVFLLLLIKLLKNNFSNLLFIDFSQRFITHRVELIKASFEMIKENFLFGVGLNNFIPNLVKVSNKFVNSWELQPVHNIFLLVLSEVGIIGLLAFCLLLFAGLTVNGYPLIAILLTGLSDHYWLTLQQNILLFTFVVVISRKTK